MLFKRFYRRHGVRRAEHLINPIISDNAALTLPRNSVLHYLPENTVITGIPADHWAVKNAERLVMVQHVEELVASANEGNPRRTSVIAGALVRQYHRKHRRLKLVRDLEANTRDVRTPLVINYAILPTLYRYTKNFFATYSRWTNIYKTLWTNIEELDKTIQRQHFIAINLPNPLPPLSVMKRANMGMSRPLMEQLNTPEHLFILEIWKWLGENRDEGIIGKISQEAVRRVNLVFQKDNRWLVVNLGIMDDFRKVAEEEEGDLNPEVLQRRFLRILVSLHESTTPTASEEENDEGQSSTVKKELSDTPQSSLEPIEEIHYDDNDESLDLELEVSEKKEVNKSLSKKDLKQLDDELDSLAEIQAPAEETIETIGLDTIETLDKPVFKKAEELAEEGLLSAAELKRFERLSKAYEELPNPYTGKGKLVDFIKIDPEDLEIKQPTKLIDNVNIVDKSMLDTTLLDFDSRYVKNVLRKDVTKAILNFNRGGVAVTNYEVEVEDDIAGKYEKHTLRLTPVTGKPSTLHFKLPVIEEDGTYTANGVKYRMRKQRGDLPIRKINSGRVALTSYYGKVFVDRSEKSVSNYAGWLTKEIRHVGLTDEDLRITQLKMARLNLNSYVLPRIYTIIATDFESFVSGDYTFYFNYPKRHKYFGEELVNLIESEDIIPIGKDKEGRILVIDNQDSFYLRSTDGDLTPIGKFEDVVSLDRVKAPIDVVDLKVFSKDIPLGVVLGYYLGIDQLIKSLSSNIKRIPSSDVLTITEDEFAIYFDDETLIVDRDDKLASIILSGFNTYKKSIKQYSINEFNKSDVYFAIFDSVGLGNRYLNELNLLRDMFIDPITLELLETLNEPKTWIGLLMKSAELLLIDHSPQETDMSQMRIKGYERISGTVYGEMINSMRSYNARKGSINASVEMKPFAIWQTINSDPAVTLVEESNPIKNLSETESVTYMGVGGRGRTSMVGRTRVFHKNDMGVISEATVDSGDVGINSYTSANPNFVSLRGLIENKSIDDLTPANLVSTSALLSPVADCDDPKRVNFINIQHAQGISAKGYSVTPLRTGYERVIGQRTGDLFAVTAKQAGVVNKVTKDHIHVKYNDGTEQKIELGRRFGKASGSVYPHELVSRLTTGSKFKEGDTIAYNKDFFTPDPLNPNLVLWKAGVMCKTAIMEASDTFEDSSAISERIAGEMTSRVTHVRHLFFNFEQTIRNLVQVGDEVEPESILCMVEDSVTANNDLFNEDTIDTLKLLSGNSPRSKYSGVVERIEVLYYGDIEDMSPSLMELAESADQALMKKRKALGLSAVNGSLSDSIRIDNKIIDLDTLVVKVYITHEEPAGIGDKGVFGNQMKTIFARVMSGVNETKSGEPLDAIFGYQSISNRIVLSPEIAGTTNTLLRVLSRKVAEVYRGG